MAGVAQRRRAKPHRQHRYRRDRFGLRLPLHRPDRLVRDAGVARWPDRPARAGMARRRYRGARHLDRRLRDGVGLLSILVPPLAAHLAHALAVAPRPSQRRQRQYDDGAAPQRARAFADFCFHPRSDRDRGGRGRGRRTDRIRGLLRLGLLQPRQYPAAARTVDCGLLRAAVASAAPRHRSGLPRSEFRRVFSHPRYHVRHLPCSTPRRVSRDRRERPGCHRASVPRLPAAPPRRGGGDVSALPWRYALTNALMVAFIAALAYGNWPVWAVAALSILVGGLIDEAVGDEHERSAGPAPLFFDANLYATLPQLVIITFLLLQATVAGGSTVVAATIGAGYFYALAGVTVAHELTHRVTSPLSLMSARALLAFTLNPTFETYHVHGHHRNVGSWQIGRAHV